MSDDILKEAQDAYRECQEREADNHRNFERDVRFARLEEQWPSGTTVDSNGTERSIGSFDDNARLTINKLAPIIRQVVNDARQNKPSISVRPMDSSADPETAEIMSGLIRNIESSSDADIAYDTAVDNAVSGGFGYFRINVGYACDDNWDKDILIDRVVNPLSIYGDPHSTAADSSDWNLAFVTDQMSRKAFHKKYKGAVETDWSPADFPDNWLEGDQITVAEYWTRSEVRRPIVLLSDGRTLSVEDMNEQAEELYANGIVPVGSPRDVMSYDVKQHILTGVEVVEEIDWVGKYIPIVPVYGDEIVLKNKRHFRSLIRSAIDAQRMLNYWASKTTEMVALAPKMPFIGRKGAFDSDPNWANVNDKSLPFVEYDGPDMPQRQPFAGVPTGMMQEMMSAAEHIKAVTGIYDASLGARSNETSGKAIRARQMEGDTSTFHFIDNLSRAIRHGGRILIDLIPKVYNSERVIRVLGVDGNAQTVPLMQPTEATAKGKPAVDEQGNAVSRIYDLTIGKYDLAVEAGPSYTTQREETRAELVEIMRAVPESASVLGPMYLRQSDWPGADEAADKLEGKDDGQQSIPPEIKEQMEQGMALIQQLQTENAQLQSEVQSSERDDQIKAKELQIKEVELRIKAKELEIDAFRAETERMQAMNPPAQPDERFAA